MKEVHGRDGLTRLPTCHRATSVKTRNRLSATKLTVPAIPDSAKRWIIT